MATAAAGVVSGAPAAPVGARSWNPNFKHSDRERWICIYPAYLNSKKSVAEGRRIAKSKAVENPSSAEIRDVIAAAGLCLGIENKFYPREFDKNVKGRVRVQLRNDDGTPVLEQFPTRQVLLEYIGETIPKLKTRQGAASQQQSSSTAAAASAGGKKGKGKKK